MYVRFPNISAGGLGGLRRLAWSSIASAAQALLRMPVSPDGEKPGTAGAAVLRWGEAREREVGPAFTTTATQEKKEEITMNQM